MPLISIIIPVYNSELYLPECLDSVCGQTIEDSEIICINDGSTDGSLRILREYEHKDSRIIIIDQPNQGVSAARNAGLQIASGFYVGFMDSDDTVEKDYFATLYQRAIDTQADAVYSKFLNVDDFIRFPKILSGQEIMKKLLPVFFREDSLNAVWNKIYRREMVFSHGITFPVGIKHGEDAQFNIEFLMRAKTITFLDYCGYHYREVDGSATRNVAAHDYLARIIEVYEFDWTPIIGAAISPAEMFSLKNFRLAHAVISLIYIYGNRGNSLTDRQRLRKLKEIVSAPRVKQVFRNPETRDELALKGYAARIFEGIRKKNIILLYLLTQYSYYRNP